MSGRLISTPAQVEYEMRQHRQRKTARALAVADRLAAERRDGDWPMEFTVAQVRAGEAALREMDRRRSGR